MTNRSTKCTFLTGFPSSNVTLLNAAWYVYYLDLEQAGVIIFLGIWDRGGGDRIQSRKSYRVKEVFLRRLFNFNTSVELKYGFLPDIYRILGKYSLIDA